MRKKLLLVFFVFIMIPAVCACEKQDVKPDEELDYLPWDTFESVTFKDQYFTATRFYGEITKADNENDVLSLYDIISKAEYTPYEEYENQVLWSGGEVYSVGMDFILTDEEGETELDNYVSVNWDVETGRLVIERSYKNPEDGYSFHFEKFIDEETSKELEELILKHAESL